jgi:hypothetical protein
MFQKAAIAFQIPAPPQPRAGDNSVNSPQQSLSQPGPPLQDETIQRAAHAKCSADCQSAVSRTANPQSVETESRSDIPKHLSNAIRLYALVQGSMLIVRCSMFPRDSWRIRSRIVCLNICVLPPLISVYIPLSPNLHFMIKKIIPALTLAWLAACLGLSCLAQENPEAAKTIGEIATAAKKFIAALDDSQRTNVLFDFKDEAQRKRWSNLPAPMFKRAGLRLGDLTPPQREAVSALLKAALSPQGYEKVSGIIEADEALKKSEGGRRQSIGHDNYYISFLGQPSTNEPWTIQYGGHHLGLNITLAGAHTTLAPTHTGVQPAIYEFEGKTVRPLGQETDKAFALLTSLDETQRKQAILGFQMHDLVLGPTRDGQTIQPEGIKGSALNDKQQAMLLDLASEWVNIMSESSAKTKMAELKQHIAETWFAWSGPLEKGKPAYFRVQGPTVIIEYAPQNPGDEATRHIHTIYRDPTNEYGKQWWPQ